MNKHYFVFMQLLLVTVVIAEPPTCTPQFKCFDADPYIYEILATNFTCLPGQICNNDHTSTDCTPCVALGKDVCKFSCTGDTTGVLHVRADQEFECGLGEVCNAAYMNSCIPCIPRICERTYECSMTNPSEVIISGVALSCAAGKICNKEYQAPCDICITDSNTSTTSTTTIKPIEPPIQYPPNCNDGYSVSNPCRPGPRRSGYYYHCRMIQNTNKYDYEIKLCKTLYADAFCSSTAHLCPI